MGHSAPCYGILYSVSLQQGEIYKHDPMMNTMPCIMEHLMNGTDTETDVEKCSL